jgi:hypothetical protein
MLSQNPDHIILNAKRIVDSKKYSEIRLNANGGNSILIVCEPNIEFKYVNSIHKLMTDETYQIIDLNDLLLKFIKENKDDLMELFELLKGSIQQIFKSPEGEIGPDFFGYIINSIRQCFEQDKIPVLINLGTLYGSGIDNIHIMENEYVMKSSLPLVILYPATEDKDQLLFLSKRPASKYRCMIIN